MREPALLVLVRACTDCTNFSVTRIELHADGRTEICDLGGHRWIAAATSDETAAIRATLASPSWLALDPGPAETSERRFELLRGAGKQVVRRSVEAARDPLLKDLVDRIGTIARRAQPRPPPPPPATWAPCAGTAL